MCKFEQKWKELNVFVKSLHYKNLWIFNKLKEVYSQALNNME